MRMVKIDHGDSPFPVILTTRRQVWETGATPETISEVQMTPGIKKLNCRFGCWSTRGVRMGGFCGYSSLAATLRTDTPTVINRMCDSYEDNTFIQKLWSTQGKHEGWKGMGAKNEAIIERYENTTVSDFSDFKRMFAGRGRRLRTLVDHGFYEEIRVPNLCDWFTEWDLWAAAYGVKTSIVSIYLNMDTLSSAMYTQNCRLGIPTD